MKYIHLILAFFMVGLTQSQQWWKPDKTELISYGVTALSGASFGLNQAISTHHYGQGKPFWDYDTSWKRKYKNYDEGDLRERFFGAKTFLVWTTDAYHLTSTAEKLFLGAGCSINVLNLNLQQYPRRDRWKALVLKKILIPIIVRSVAFELTYKNL